MSVQFALDPCMAFSSAHCSPKIPVFVQLQLGYVIIANQIDFHDRHHITSQDTTVVMLAIGDLSDSEVSKVSLVSFEGRQQATGRDIVRRNGSSYLWTGTVSQIRNYNPFQVSG